MQILKFKSAHIGYRGQAFTINNIVKRPNALKNNEKWKISYLYPFLAVELVAKLGPFYKK